MPARDAVLGLIWPDDGGPRCDYEMLRLGPWLARHGLGEVRVEVARSRAGRLHTPGDLRFTGSLENLRPAARELAGRGCGAVVWACTSGSFIGGLAWARRQAQALARAAGVPASSNTLALIDAARALGAGRVDVLGAYPEPATQAFAGCLRDAALELGAVAWLDSPEGAASFELDMVDQVARFARAHPGRPHPLLVPDTAVNTLERAGALETLAARPVVTANQATLWQGLRLLGVGDRIEGAGSLLGLAPPGAARGGASA